MIALLTKNENSRILNFVKSPKIKNSRKFKHAKITRSTVCDAQCWTFSSHKWNESGFRPPLCTYRLNWARRTSWGWWDDWDDTVLQTQDPKFEPWRSEAEHATSRSRRLPTILTFTRGWGRNIFNSCKPPRPGTEPRTLAWKAAVLTTILGPPPFSSHGQFHPVPSHHGTSALCGSMLATVCDAVPTLASTASMLCVYWVVTKPWVIWLS